MIITDELKEKIKQTKFENTLNFQPGDRIYIPSKLKIKKRQVDKYLKANFTDVKRVSKLNKCNAIISHRNDYGKHTKISTLNSHTGYLFKGRYYGSYWQFRNNLHDLIQSDKSKYNVNNCYISTRQEPWYLDTDSICKHYPDILQYTDYLTISNDLDDENYNHLIENVSDIKFYQFDQIEKVVDKFTNDNLESTDSIDIDMITTLFKSGDSTNAKLAIQLMGTFDMRDHYVDLLMTFYHAKCQGDSQIILKKYMRKSPIFKNMNLPNCGLYASDIECEGFMSFRRNLHYLKNTHNFEIDFIKISKYLFNE